MKSFSGSLSAAGLAVALALIGAPAMAQQKNGPAPTVAIPGKPVSPAAIAAAKEILTMKNAVAMYANAIPLTAMLIAVLWLGESISGGTMIGTAAIIGGVLLTRLAPKRGPATEPAQA